jgi:Kdo2-lipid IVA lauroyltransferase/acyltransferase
MAFRDDFALRAMRLLVKIFSMIPLCAGQKLGAFAGRFFSKLGLCRETVVKDGLRRAFPDLSEGEVRDLYSRVVSHFGQMFFEVPHILRLNSGNLDEYVVFEHPERLEQALLKGRGALVLTGHFGNWELMSAAISLKLQGRAAVVARPLDYEPAELLLRGIRTRFGTEIIPKNMGLRRMLRALRENLAVGVLLDQNVDWYDGVFVPFLGGEACTNKGLALVALKTGSPVMPVFSVRRADGRLSIVFEEEIPVIRSRDRTRDVEENTARFTRVIESYVLRYPDHWFWFHRRWKTRPFCPIPAGYWDGGAKLG